MKTSSCARSKRALPILCSAAVVLLGAFGTIDAQSRASAGPSDHLIIPGVRIGPVFLGMTERELYQKLGNPSNTVRGNDGKWVRYSFGPPVKGFDPISGTL